MSGNKKTRFEGLSDVAREMGAGKEQMSYVELDEKSQS
jgi:hypothetical protein